MSHEFIADRWEDLQCIQSVRMAGVNDPVLSPWQPGGAGSLRVYEFVNTGTRELFFTAQLPHSARNGTIIKPHVHFATRSTANTGVVRWQLEYTIQSPMSTAYVAPTTIGGSYTFGANMQDIHLVQSIDSGTITLPSTGSSHILVGRLFRAGGVAPDTFAASVFLLGFDFHYQVNKNGTVAEFGP